MVSRGDLQLIIWSFVLAEMQSALITPFTTSDWELLGNADRTLFCEAAVKVEPGDFFLSIVIPSGMTFLFK